MSAGRAAMAWPLSRSRCGSSALRSYVVGTFCGDVQTTFAQAWTSICPRALLVFQGNHSPGSFRPNSHKLFCVTQLRHCLSYPSTPLKLLKISRPWASPLDFCKRHLGALPRALTSARVNFAPFYKLHFGCFKHILLAFIFQVLLTLLLACL